MGALRKARPGAETARGASTSTETGSEAFLGVSASARGLAWREHLEAHRAKDAAAISERHDLPEILGRVLAARGVGLEEVELFLAPTVKALMPDPARLKDMDRAAGRIADAIERGEAVAVFGDYDVDGACSAALMQRFLAHHGLAARVYIPDRLTEGYGPNPDAIGELVAGGAKLIITVDCGTTSESALEVAGQRGADVVVIDHHQADERLPRVTALVNPNRQDDISGQGHLAAAGVTFLVLVATARELRQRGFYTAGRPERALLGDLDLVALATVADVVPLIGLNRAFVTKGLGVMRGRENVGLRALGDAASLSQAPTTYHLGYILGPRINAGGRIGDAALGARLLATDDETEAVRIATLLDRLNKERKAIEQAAVEEALAMGERLLEASADRALVLVGSDTWHKGIIGLVASRLVERFKRPACVIAWDAAAAGGDAMGTGSLRSVAGVDIGAAVRAAVAAGHLAKGGGHAMAAGLTVARSALAALEAHFETALARTAGEARANATLAIDGALTAGAANDKLIDLVERAGPFGQGNPQPRFVLPAHRVRFAKIVGETHVRCVLEADDGSRLDAVAFRAAASPVGELLLGAGGLPLHIAGSLKRDTWGGRDRIEMTIEDVADPRRQG